MIPEAAVWAIYFAPVTAFLLNAAERCSSKEFPAEWAQGLEKLLAHSDAKIRQAAIAFGISAR